MWFTLRLLLARYHLCRAEWISGLRRQRQHRERHVSLDFELSTRESLQSIQLSLVHRCAQCSGWRVSSSSVSTAHMSFDLVRYSVTVDTSSLLGDVGNPFIVKFVFWHFATSCDHNCKSDIESPMEWSPENKSSIGNLVICCVTIARSATMRTDHRIRVCDFVYLFLGSFVSVACSGALCSCVRPSHPRPSHAVGTGVPWVSLPGPTSVPRQGGIGDKAPPLCCACVASSWYAHLTIWNCGVGNVCADCHEMSAPPLELNRSRSLSQH